jgi:Tol biopolymer transport system component
MMLPVVRRLSGWGILAGVVAIGLALGVGASIPRGPQLAYLSTCNRTDNLALADIRYRITHRLTCDPNSIVKPVWSPDGTYLAYYHVDGILFSLRLANMTTGHYRAYPLADGLVFNIQQPITWSPDGAYLVFVGFREGGRQVLYRLDVATGQALPLTDGDRDALEPQWSPVAADTLTFRQGNRLYMLDPTDPTSPPQPIRNSSDAAFVRWAASGDRIQFDYTTQDLLRISPDGTIQAITPNRTIRINALAPAPDGEQIALLTTDPQQVLGLSIVNTQTGAVDVLLYTAAYLSDPRWSPDGAYIAYTATRQRNDDITLYHLPTRRTYPLATSHARDWSPRWRPNPR